MLKGTKNQIHIETKFKNVHDECSKRAHGKICLWVLLTVNTRVWFIYKIEVMSMIWVNTSNSVTSWSVCKWILLSSTVEAPLRGHPRAAEKVFVSGTGRLREFKNTEFVYELSKTGVLWRWPWVELSAYQTVRYESFHCIMFFCLVSTICLLYAVHLEYHRVWLKQRLNPGYVLLQTPALCRHLHRHVRKFDGDNWSSRRIK